MIEDIISHGSYLTIVVVLLFTGNGLPIPEELLVVTAGILSANGYLNPWLAALACLVGAFGGDCITYYLGYRYGHRIFKGRHFWNRLVTPEREAAVEDMFHRHGFKVLFVARFLVGLRPAIHLTAGILRLSFRRYLLTDLFCASIVVGTFFALSYFFGQPIFAWIRRFEILVTVVVVVSVAVAILLVRQRYKRHVNKVLQITQASESRPVCEEPSEPPTEDASEESDRQTAESGTRTTG